MSGNQDSHLSHEEIRRYARHVIMAEVGMDGQRKLKASRVLIVGTGGLGSPAALYLAAAGVGRLGLVDYDVVDESNLQRQIIHGQDSLGQSKLASAEKRLRNINPFVQLEKHAVPLNSSNALEIIAPYDVVIDGTDNFPTRYLINDACVKLGKPNVYGSIFQFEGQLSVFDATKGPCYRCLFPTPPPPGTVPNCAEAGVLGVLPGTIGTMQATEGIKLILGIGDPMIGRLLLYDALDMSFTTIHVRKNPNCPVCSIPAGNVELIDYEEFCGVPAHDHSDYAKMTRNPNMKTITVQELKARRDAQDPITVLDVRNPQEWMISALDETVRLPMLMIQQAANAVVSGRSKREETILTQIPPDQEIVVLCRSGIRSADVIFMLQKAGYDPDKLYNLAGGILAWSREIDPSLPLY